MWRDVFSQLVFSPCLRATVIDVFNVDADGRFILTEKPKFELTLQPMKQSQERCNHVFQTFLFRKKTFNIERWKVKFEP